jgi:GNAT superfamily N-acetyltransferase
MDIKIEINDDVQTDEVAELYRANKWSSADKPKQLMAALKNSHSLIIARLDDRLIGLANALSDGHLVVYYPHLLVHPEFQGQGVGQRIMESMREIYSDYHQQILVADGKAINFYRSVGFERAGKSEPMWIYDGDEHS